MIVEGEFSFNGGIKVYLIRGDAKELSALLTIVFT